MNKILKKDVLEVVTPHSLSLEIFVYFAKSAVKVTLCGTAAKQLYLSNWRGCKSHHTFIYAIQES